MRALMLLIPLAGCSLMGLDDVQATACSTAGVTSLTAAHATCLAELGGMPLAACQAHICALQIDDQLFCTIGAPDVDGDGVGDAACIREGSELLRDCDDSDPAVGQGRSEICDGKDNDCDGRVDENVIVVTDPIRLESTDDATTAGVVGTAVIAETVVAAFRRDIATVDSLHVLLGMAPTSVESSGVITLANSPGESLDPGIAIGGDDGTTFVVFPASRCAGRLSAGSVVSGELVSSSFGTSGLPSLSGNACADAVGQRAPAVAVTRGEAVIAWLESDSRGACGTGARAPLIATTTAANAPLNSPTIALSDANDAGPPALLALPSLDLFVLARGEGNELVVSTLRRTGDSLEVVSTARVDVGNTVEDFALTEGPSDTDRTELGVAFSAGCGTNAVVGVQRLSLLRADASLSALGDVTPVEGGSSQRQPAIAFGVEFPRGYFVAWREGDERVQGQLIDESEGVSGDAMTILGASNFDGTPLSRVRGVGVAARAEGGFQTLAYVQSSETGFHENTVSCASE